MYSGVLSRRLYDSSVKSDAHIHTPVDKIEVGNREQKGRDSVSLCPVLRGLYIAVLTINPPSIKVDPYLQQ